MDIPKKHLYMKRNYKSVGENKYEINKQKGITNARRYKKRF